jgi:hypothetical protein
VDPKSEEPWASARSVEAGAREFVRHLYDQWRNDAALVRVYASTPLDRLPPKRREFAFAAAPGLKKSHSVLSLLGSFGMEEDWQDVFRSRGHLAIPLLDPQQIEGLPMISALFEALGSPLDPPALVRRMIGGGNNALFYVEDAATGRDAKGRAIVPGIEFVKKYGIKTVIGGGGLYLDRSFLCVISFFRSRIDRRQADRMAAGMAAFKAAMARLVRDGPIFEPS